MHLGLEKEDIEKIERDHHGIERRLTEVISHWQRNFGDCSWKALANAVEKMGGHANLVKTLRLKAQEPGPNTSQISGQGIYITNGLSMFIQ